MPSKAYNAIRQAILDKSQLNCIYQGLERSVCPHVIGKKLGREQILVFQFAGQSSKGLPPGGEWRCMDVSKIINIRVFVGEWRTGMNHSRPQTCVDEIDVEVDF